VKDKRLRQIKSRKNFLPTLLISFGLWLLLGVIIYFVDPDISWAKPAFFVTFFTALFLTFSLLAANTRRGFTIAVVVTLFATLRLLGVGNVLNLFLLAGVAIASEIYFNLTK